MVNLYLTTFDSFIQSKHICASDFPIGREQLELSLSIRSLLLLIKTKTVFTSSRGQEEWRRWLRILSRIQPSPRPTERTQRLDEALMSHSVWRPFCQSSP